MAGAEKNDIVGLEFGENVGSGVAVDGEIGCLGILRNYN